MNQRLVLFALLALAAGCAAHDSTAPIIPADGSADGAVGGGQAGDDGPIGSLIDDPLYDGGSLEDGQVQGQFPDGGMDLDAAVLADGSSPDVDSSLSDAAMDADAGPDLNACGGTGPLRLSSATWYATENVLGATCACSPSCTTMAGVDKVLVCGSTPDELHCQACKCGA